MSLQARAQAATTEYQKLQADLQNAVDARQRLDSQLQENEMVKKVSTQLSTQWPDFTWVFFFLKEFAQLTPNNTVYKLVGPVLVPQDQAEAKSNVDTRLEFIRGEM